MLASMMRIMQTLAQSCMSIRLDNSCKGLSRAWAKMSTKRDALSKESLPSTLEMGPQGLDRAAPEERASTPQVHQPFWTSALAQTL